MNKTYPENLLPQNTSDLASTQSNIIDIAQLKSLCALQNQTYYVALLIEKFITHASQSLTQMTRAAEDHDISVILDLTHKLKGSAGSIGASLFANGCATIYEYCLNNVRKDHLVLLIEELWKTLEKTKNEYGRLFKID